jgi:hypothetical protein
MINLFVFLTSIEDAIFLRIDPSVERRDDAIRELKKRYNVDDAFWTDAKEVALQVEMLVNKGVKAV